MSKEIKNEKSGWFDKTFDNPGFRSVVLIRNEEDSVNFDYLIERLELPADTSIVQLSITEVSYCRRHVLCSFCGTENNAHHSAACVDKRRVEIT